VVYCDFLDREFAEHLKKYDGDLRACLRLAIEVNREVLFTSTILPSHGDEETSGFMDLCEAFLPVDISFKNYFLFLIEFMNTPARSKTYSLSQWGPKLYGNAILACFEYLKTGKHFTLANDTYDMERYERHSHVADDRSHGFCECSLGMKEWIDGLSSPDLTLITGKKLILRTYTHDNQFISEEKFLLPCSPEYLRIRFNLNYYLMMGFLIFFLPRAEKSEGLINYCADPLPLCMSFTHDLGRKSRIYGCARYATERYVNRMK